MLCFCFTRILLASVYCIKKKLRLAGTVIQELTRQSKIHEQSIHSTATKTIIETSQEYFSISIYSQKCQASFYSVNVLVLHKLCSQKFITRTHISTNSPVLSRPRSKSKSKYVLYNKSIVPNSISLKRMFRFCFRFRFRISGFSIRPLGVFFKRTKTFSHILQQM